MNNNNREDGIVHYSDKASMTHLFHQLAMNLNSDSNILINNFIQNSLIIRFRYESRLE